VGGTAIHSTVNAAFYDRYLALRQRGKAARDVGQALVLRLFAGAVAGRWQARQAHGRIGTNSPPSIALPGQRNTI